MDEEDERIKAWHTIAKHPFFRKAHSTDGALLDAMIQALDGLSRLPNVDITQAEEPVEWRLLRAFTNGYAEGMRRALDGRLDR